MVKASLDTNLYEITTLQIWKTISANKGGIQWTHPPHEGTKTKQKDTHKTFMAEDV
jgi:hypothetical protein